MHIRCLVLGTHMGLDNEMAPSLFLDSKIGAPLDFQEGHFFVLFPIAS